MMKVRVMFVLMCGIMWSCSDRKPLDIPPVPPQEEQLKYIPVEKLVFRLNDGLYEIGGANPPDTAKLQEEGLRTLEIVGYEPADATQPAIEAVNFYRDIYSFNFTGDSIYILGGSHARPKNHYVSPVGDGFEVLVGKKVPPAGRGEDSAGHLPAVRFYNYVDRSYDETVIDRGNGPETVKWSTIGRNRLYRIEVEVSAPNAAGETEHKVFSLPFHELENTVGIMDLQDGVIEISPGDTINLRKLVNAPSEFTQGEWVKGNATARFNPLNGDAVEQTYRAIMENPLLTEKGMLYTCSMVLLQRDGLLTVNPLWNPQDARANGGAVYATVPICVIMMPQGGSQSDSLGREFLFPDSTLHKEFPTPFFCNAQVRIVYL